LRMTSGAGIATKKAALCTNKTLLWIISGYEATDLPAEI
jgi:hypothetical protein